MRSHALTIALWISVGVVLPLVPAGSSASPPLTELQALRTETVPASCRSYSSGNSEPVDFIDQGGAESVRLLLDSTVVRPGEQLLLAPLNMAQRPISYGLQTSARAAATGRPLRGTGFSPF